MLVAAQRKPLGLILVILYTALAALMALPVGCTMTLAGQVPGVPPTASLLGVLFTLVGIVSCAAVYGLWTFQDWGRSLAFWLYLVGVPLGLIAIFPPMAGPKVTPGNTAFQLVGIALDLVVMNYLCKPEVRRLFSGRERSRLVSVADR